MLRPPKQRKAPGGQAYCATMSEPTPHAPGLVHSPPTETLKTVLPTRKTGRGRAEAAGGCLRPRQPPALAELQLHTTAGTAGLSAGRAGVHSNDIGTPQMGGVPSRGQAPPPPPIRRQLTCTTQWGLHAQLGATGAQKRRRGGRLLAREQRGYAPLASSAARGRRSGCPQSACVGLTRLGSQPASAGLRREGKGQGPGQPPLVLRCAMLCFAVLPCVFV